MLGYPAIKIKEENPAFHNPWVFLEFRLLENPLEVEKQRNLVSWLHLREVEILSQDSCFPSLSIFIYRSPTSQTHKSPAPGTV